MGRNNVEILPPSVGTVPVRPPARHAWPEDLFDGGVLSPVLTRWRENRRARTLNAMTTTMVAAKAFFEARAEAIDACFKSREAEYRLWELPSIAAADAARREEERTEVIRDLRGRHVLEEIRHMTARAEAEAGLLTAAHAFAARRDLGAEIAWGKQAGELLDVEMALAERRAVMRQHLLELEQSERGRSEARGSDPIEDALYEARGLLRAHGLDTTGIDAVLERRIGRT
jgi:hypothetical protein